jgi:hypothetical protein
MATLFSGKNQPLAAKIRPRAIDEIIGQEHLLAPGKSLRKLIEADEIKSIVLFGPAGTGKTTVAEVIANKTKLKFIRMNATNASVKDIRKEGDIAQETGEKAILFIDECLVYNSLIIVRYEGKILLMPIGYIVNNKINCNVLSYDTNSKSYEWQPIISWSIVSPKPIIEITMVEEDHEFILRCSEDHLIYTTNRGYVKAIDLDVNDELVSPIKDIMHGKHDFTKALRDMFKEVHS